MYKRPKFSRERYRERVIETTCRLIQDGLEPEDLDVDAQGDEQAAELRISVMAFAEEQAEFRYPAKEI